MINTYWYGAWTPVKKLEPGPTGCESCKGPKGGRAPIRPALQKDDLLGSPDGGLSEGGRPDFKREKLLQVRNPYMKLPSLGVFVSEFRSSFVI